GAGARSEKGAGNIVNAPLAPGSGTTAFRAAFDETIFPALEAFAPELVLISAGFDAHRLDPLANLNLGADDYAWVTRGLVGVAEEHADGRVGSMRAGGYS